MRSHSRLASIDGFSLVELSVVLAIIGLLVGGIIGGQSLIKSTELKSILSDFSKYRSAYNQFKAQYAGPPGDIADATDYWSTIAGNGDGELDITNDYAETFRAWQQLQLAGFIDETYTGTANSVTAAPSANTKYGSATVAVDSVPGSNVPRGKRINTGYSLFYMPTIAAGNTANYTDFYYGDYGTVLLYGAAVATDIPKGAALTPEEAYNIDAKSDDGIAASGKIFTLATTSSSCVSTQTVSTTTAAYAVSNAAVACTIGMKIDQ